jgi:hypothetical protein
VVNRFGGPRGVCSVVDLDSPSAILEIGSEDDMSKTVFVGAETLHDPLSIESEGCGLRIGF